MKTEGTVLQVRAAVYKDIDAISEVLATSWKSAYRGIVNDDYLDRLKNSHWIDFLSAGLNDGNIFVRVLEDDQHIAGVAILSPEKMNIVNLVSFYLLPDKIGRGFGHAFYESIQAELIGKGFSKCMLDVLENNERAIRFYEAHGFVKTNKTIMATLGNCEYPCNVYEKQFI
ncbi:GNAT family N-acetyltransferase [Clostridia bacterium OttesenSCG-928-F22]|nr:GNAT family N-acetyltransferase [Clostridia bacterium OttesenSCG-928-F22]